MDKELLRLVIIVIGGIVIVGMVLWSAFKNKRPRRGIDFYDSGNPLENIDDSLKLNLENDDFDIVPLGSAVDAETPADPISVASEAELPQSQANTFEVPNIIQFSIVASADDGFNGNALLEAFQLVGLEYGNMKIFERLDEQRRVDFAVASMVEPGTFPDSDIESFTCPGIVFFLQPGAMENPLPVFDDFIQTINLLATELDGIKWDNNRQPLTNETIQQFRKSFTS